tara:strand:- start:17 stop:571 length:555 start_codon:yes stop_codon:yes gene_type:complete
MNISKYNKIEKVVSKDPNRHILQKAWLETDREKFIKATREHGKGELVATDGRKLVCIEVDIDKNDTSGQIDCAAISASRKRPAIESLACDVEKVTVLGSNMTFERNNDMKFPNVKVVANQNETACRETVLTVGLNAKFLYECSQAMGTDELKLSFVDNENPIAIEPIRTKGNPSTAILMPIRCS